MHVACAIVLLCVGGDAVIKGGASSEAQLIANIRLFVGLTNRTNQNLHTCCQGFSRLTFINQHIHS